MLALLHSSRSLNKCVNQFSLTSFKATPPLVSQQIIAQGMMHFSRMQDHCVATFSLHRWVSVGIEMVKYPKMKRTERGAQSSCRKKKNLVERTPLELPNIIHKLSAKNKRATTQQMKERCGV